MATHVNVVSATDDVTSSSDAIPMIRECSPGFVSADPITTTIEGSPGRSASNKYNILILDAGGTICMQPNNAGLLVPQDDVILNFIHSSSMFSAIRPFIHVVPVLRIDSSDITLNDWRKLCEAVRKGIFDGYKGIVVTHGTDTLAYSAAILTFAFRSLCTPVVLTVAQFPLLSAYTDAVNNLFGACIIALGMDSRNVPWLIPEVTVFMNHTLHLGSRITKVNATEIDAFSSPSTERLGVWTEWFHYNETMVNSILLARGKEARRLLQHNNMLMVSAPSDCSNIVDAKTFIREWTDALTEDIRLIPCVLPSAHVALIRLYPGDEVQANGVMFSPCVIQLQALRDAGVKYFVIQAFGAGNAGLSVVNWIRHPDQRACFFVVVTQCTKGFVTACYGSCVMGDNVKNVVQCNDMTAECAFGKFTIFASWAEQQRARNEKSKETFNPESAFQSRMGQALRDEFSVSFR